MKKGKINISYYLLLIYMLLGITNAGASGGSLMSLDDIPSWISRNIRFPESAYDYGFAGKERFVVSIDWQGRVFITSGLNTLHPVFSREIESVVRRAPRCRAAGMLAADLYKDVEIDFHALIPQERRKEVTDVGEYRFAIFPRHEATVLDNSRENFIDWLSERYDLPEGFNSYMDTVTVSYTITEGGRVQNAEVKGVRSEILMDKLTDALKKAPSWSSAVTRQGKHIKINVCDSFIIGTDAEGRKLPPALIKDEVCRNSVKVPVDADMVVLNPEIKAIFNGLQSSLNQMLRDSIGVNRRIRYSALMIIGKDGKVVECLVESEDSELNARLKGMINTSQWLPAVQGGIPVKSVYSFNGILSPKKDASSDKMSRPQYYGSVITSGRHAAFQDPHYEEILRKRWKKLTKIYPSLEADIYGYEKFRRMDRQTYLEALIVRGAWL